MEYALHNSYPGIAHKGRCSCGGNQNLLKSAVLQHYGCGAVAALDLARYLHLYHAEGKSALFTGIPETEALPQPLYDLCVQRLCHRFIPVLPGIATNGISLCAGMNAYFQHYGMPYRAAWGVEENRLWEEISRMLQQDLPVILGIGKPVKHLLANRKLTLYHYSNSIYAPAREVSGHFVTVFAQDEEWLYISSWGKSYAINRGEFLQFSHAESAHFLCNILRIFRQV